MGPFSTLLVFSCFFFLVSYSECSRELKLGGPTGSWEIPSSGSESLNDWSQRSRFIIGDTLVWKYDGAKDSVLEVNKRDYVTCNTSSPLAAYKDGNTKVKLENSGPYYFISGAEGNCEKGQKLSVVVLSEKHSRGVFSGSPSPAPSPVEEIEEGAAPAIAPVAGCASGLTASLWMAVALGAGILFCFNSNGLARTSS